MSNCWHGLWQESERGVEEGVGTSGEDVTAAALAAATAAKTLGPCKSSRAAPR